MSSTRTTAAEFDQISVAYDSTREPLDEITLNAAASELRAAEVGRLLEVGVGTGRIALPLTERGFAITGIDASSGMLARARAKGVERLVRGSAYRLPFESGEFDATLFVHVLHVLEDPRRALTEAIRVGRGGAFAIVHPRRRSDEEATNPDSVRGMVREELVKAGYSVPDRGGGPARRERELLEQHPPDRLTVLSDREITAPVSRRLDALSARAHRYTLQIPPEVLERAVATVREKVGERTVTYRQVEALAHWSE